MKWELLITNKLGNQSLYNGSIAAYLEIGVRVFRALACDT